MKLRAVSVIETVNGDLIGIKSFTDDKRGNRDAEKVFTACAIANGARRSEITSLIEAGYCSVGDYILYIAHSA